VNYVIVRFPAEVLDEIEISSKPDINAAYLSAIEDWDHTRTGIVIIRDDGEPIIRISPDPKDPEKFSFSANGEGLLIKDRLDAIRKRLDGEAPAAEQEGGES
jgi:hypothetical protein